MLKKCPFCGGEAQARTSRDKNGGMGFAVICMACGASGPNYYTRNNYWGDGSMWDDDELKNAVDAWNRRADPGKEAEC